MELGRGITIYKGERGFLKDSFDVSNPVDIVFTVATRLDVQRLRNLVHKILALLHLTGEHSAADLA